MKTIRYIVENMVSEGNKDCITLSFQTEKEAVDFIDLAIEEGDTYFKGWGFRKVWGFIDENN